MPSWEDLEYNWLEAPSIVVRKSLEKCSQGGKDATIGNQGHEAGASFDLNIVHIELMNLRLLQMNNVRIIIAKLIIWQHV